MFSPYFRSDLHAEMVVMNIFEERHPEIDTMQGYTLVSSIEPCLMCFARLPAGGVPTVKFLAEDAWGGMVNRRQHLPAAWQRLGQRRSGRLPRHPRRLPPKTVVALTPVVIAAALSRRLRRI